MSKGPRIIVWDITYACPLRCAHCYSESGRRPTKQLDVSDLFHATDALISAGPEIVVLSGGEPLVVKQIFEVAKRFHDAGIQVVLYTSGWCFTPGMVVEIMAHVSRVTVSLDGATASVHDRLRGRVGSFDRASRVLEELDFAIGNLRARNEPAPRLGIDFVVMQSNVHQLQEFCSSVAPKYAELSDICFGAVIPTGLGSRPSFAEHELLTDEQMSALTDERLVSELQSMVPSSVAISTTDVRKFQMHPDLLDSGMDIPPMQVEPDGMVRAMPVYEGTVGSILREPVARLWERAMHRWNDPFVLKVLTPATSIQSWAEATREIDQHFGSPQDIERIARRPAYRRG